MILMTDTIGVDDVVFLRESKHRIFMYACMYVFFLWLELRNEYSLIRKVIDIKIICFFLIVNEREREKNYYLHNE